MWCFVASLLFRKRFLDAGNHTQLKLLNEGRCFAFPVEFLCNIQRHISYCPSISASYCLFYLSFWLGNLLAFRQCSSELCWNNDLEKNELHLRYFFSLSEDSMLHFSFTFPRSLTFFLCPTEQLKGIGNYTLTICSFVFAFNGKLLLPFIYDSPGSDFSIIMLFLAREGKRGVISKRYFPLSFFITSFKKF